MKNFSRILLACALLFGLSETDALAQCSVPSSLNVTDVDSNDVTMNWDVVGDASYYKVRYRIKGTSPWTYKTTGLATNSYAASGLTTGTTYQWAARSFCDGGTSSSSWSSSVEFTTAFPAVDCFVPSGTADSAFDAVTHRLIWESVGDADNGYRLRWRQSGDSWTNVSGITDTTYDLTPVFGEDYNWQVRSDCPGEFSEWSDQRDFTFYGVVNCETPASTSDAPSNDTTQVFTWGDVTDADSFRVRYRQSGGDWTIVTGVSDTTWDFEPLMVGVDYNWQVRSDCPGELSSWANQRDFTFYGVVDCQVPSATYETPLDVDSATLGWGPVADADSFKIRWRESGGSWVFIDGILDTSFNLGSLIVSSDYNWQVRSVCPGELSDWTNQRDFTHYGVVVCDIPSVLSEDSLTDTTATLFWNNISDASTYRLRWREEGEGWTNVLGIADSNYALTGLSAGQTYRWQVRSDCPGELSDWATEQNFVAPYAVDTCRPPQNHANDSLLVSSAKVIWDTVDEALSYKIRWRATGDPSWTTITGVTNTDTSYWFTSLSDNVLHRWQIRSVCTADEAIQSDWATELNFTTAECTSPTSNFVESSITSSSANLAWDALAGVQGYDVVYTVKGTLWKDTVRTLTNSVSLAGLFSGTTYRWEVRGICDSSAGAYSDYTISPSGDRKQFVTTGASACSQISGLSETSVGDNTADLSWTSSGATNYEVVYRVVGTPSWIYEPYVGTNTHTLTGLAAGMNYQWRVRGICSADTQLLSKWASINPFTTTGAVGCAAPTGGTLTDSTESTADLSWNSATSATQYIVRYKAEGTSTWLNTSSGSTSVTLTSLGAGTQYTWMVRSDCSADSTVWSDWSSEMTFTTGGTNACDVVSATYLDTVEATQATAVWSVTTGAATYKVRYRVQGGGWIYLSGISDTSYTFLGLVAETDYNYQVRAECAGGLLGVWSYQRSFTTPAAARVGSFGTNVNSSYDYSLAPNPVSEILNVTLENPMDKEVELIIVDMYGRVVFNNYYGGGSVEASVDLRDEHPGVYFVNFILGNQERIVEKVILK